MLKKIYGHFEMTDYNIHLFMCTFWRNDDKQFLTAKYNFFLVLLFLIGKILCCILISWHIKYHQHSIRMSAQFSVPQIEYPLGSNSKMGSHVYFLLIVAMVLLLWHQIVLLWCQVTMVTSEQHLYPTKVLPRKLEHEV